MGLLVELFERRAAQPGAQHPSAITDPWLRELLGITAANSAGIVVNQQTALALTQVYAAVKNISEGIAFTPLLIYERLEDGGKRRAPGHPLWPLFNLRPNRWQRPGEFKEFMVASYLLHGNAYAIILRDELLRITELLPVPPRRMRPFVDPKNEMLLYDYTPRSGGGVVRYFADEVFHLRGLSLDGIMGIDPITYEAEALGAGLATQAYSASWFRGGGRPGGLLKLASNKTISPERRKELRAEWAEMFGGPTNLHQTAILDDGMDFKEIAIDPIKSQMIEARHYTTEDISRIYNVTPYKLGDMRQAKWGNVEHLQIEHVTQTLRPHYVRFEEAVEASLIGEGDRRFFAEFLIEALLRGDTLTRYQAYGLARQWGWFSINDIRRRENENGIGAAGDVHLTPLNMVNAEELVAAAGDPLRRHLQLLGEEGARRAREARASQAARLRRRLRTAHRRLFAAELERQARRDLAMIEAKRQKLAAEDLAIWLAAHCAARELDLARAFLPVLGALTDAIGEAAEGEIAEGGEPADLEAIVSELARGLARRYCRELSLAGGGEGFVERLPAFAALEAVRAAEAAALEAWRRLGVTRVRWRAGAEACAEARRLDGQAVDLGLAFAGTEARHPPLCQACDCLIVAEP